MRPSRTAALVAATMALVLGGSAPAAHADRPLVQEHYSDSESGGFDDCGFP